MKEMVLSQRKDLQQDKTSIEGKILHYHSKLVPQTTNEIEKQSYIGV